MQQTPSPNARKQANREIAAMVARLLSHYWTADDPAPARKAQIEDWIEDLSEFGPELVKQAITEFRHSGSRNRPVPGDIRTLCVQIDNNRRERQAIADQRRERWPQWLEETWGPEPEGPRLRAEAMARDRVKTETSPTEE